MRRGTYTVSLIQLYISFYSGLDAQNRREDYVYSVNGIRITHSGIPDATERQVMDDRLKGAFIDCSITRRR
jgi:hypothetical protein